MQAALPPQFQGHLRAPGARLESQPTSPPVKLSNARRPSSASRRGVLVLQAGSRTRRPAGRFSASTFADDQRAQRVFAAGLSTNGQPAAIAGATLCATRLSGKLNG